MTGNPMSASEADITTVLNIPFLDRMSTYDPKRICAACPRRDGAFSKSGATREL